MTESKSLSEQRQSRKVQTNRGTEIPPGELPWDEELVTFGRDLGKLLAWTQRENLHLRLQLKQLNQKLDTAIEETKARREAKPAHTPQNTSSEELKSAQIHLSNTEKEHSRFKTRFELLSDPNYLQTLVDTVQEQSENVKRLEQSRLLRQQKQTKREKVLETVLETGETPEMAKEVGQQLKELEVLRSKVRQVEKAGRKSAISYEQMRLRSEELTRETAQLRAEVGDIPEEADKSTEMELERVKKAAESQTVQHKSSQSKLKTRIVQLQAELQALTQQQQLLQSLIQDKSVSIDQFSAALKDLQPLSKHPSAKSIPAQRSKSTSRRVGETFLTEARSFL